MKTTFLIVRVFLAAIFIFSGLAKVMSLSFFDNLVAELLIGQDYYNHPQALWYTQLLSRVLMSGEIVLGIAVLQDKYLKKIILPGFAILLIVFTGHLTYMGMERGFIGGNCGCFGELLPLDNFESIIKNIITLGLVVFLYVKTGTKNQASFRPVAIPIISGLIVFLTLFLSIKSYDIEPQQPVASEGNIKDMPEINTVEPTKDTTDVFVDKYDTAQVEKDTLVTTIEKDAKAKANSDIKNDQPKKEDNRNTSTTKPTAKKSKYAEYNQFSNGEKVDLTKGEKMVAMFSLTCGHCKEVYKDMCSIREKAGFPPIYLITYGAEFDQKIFFSQAGCSHPYIRIEEGNMPAFSRLLENSEFPRIEILKDGELVKVWDLDSYSFEKLKEYFGVKDEKDTEEGMFDDLQSPDNSATPWDF